MHHHLHHLPLIIVHSAARGFGYSAGHALFRAMGFPLAMIVVGLALLFMLTAVRR